MNPKILMAVALCVASVSTTAFAEDDFGIESASPIEIADPINPQPGMVLSGYKGSNVSVSDSWLKESVPTLRKAPAIKTVIDKSETFSLKALGSTEANAGMWSGFLKCKRAGIYTITLTGKKTINDGYSVRVNGNSVVGAGKGQTSADAALKVGWNKIEIVCQFSNNPRSGRGSLSIAYKPKESLSDARPLTPAMLFYDQKPEEDW